LPFSNGSFKLEKFSWCVEGQAVGRLRGEYAIMNDWIERIFHDFRLRYEDAWTAADRSSDLDILWSEKNAR